MRLTRRSARILLLTLVTCWFLWIVTLALAIGGYIGWVTGGLIVAILTLWLVVYGGLAWTSSFRSAQDRRSYYEFSRLPLSPRLLAYAAHTAGWPTSPVVAAVLSMPLVVIALFFVLAAHAP